MLRRGLLQLHAEFWYFRQLLCMLCLYLLLLHAQVQDFIVQQLVLRVNAPAVECGDVTEYMVSAQLVWQCDRIHG
jgi:hypothetical protein